MNSNEVRISKEILSSLPEEYKETPLGDKKGAQRQYRGSSGTHVREYEESFTVHIDKVDPRRDVMGHLLVDSPESMIAFGASLFLVGRAVSRTSSKHRFAKCHDDVLEGRRNRPSFVGLFGFPLFLASFFSLNAILRRIKYLLFYH